MREQQEKPADALASLFNDERHLRGDLVLLRRAVDRGWIQSATHGQAAHAAIDRAFAMIEAMPECRVKIRATLRLGEVLLTMDEQDLAALNRALDAQLRRRAAAGPPGVDSAPGRFHRGHAAQD